MVLQNSGLCLIKVINIERIDHHIPSRLPSDLIHFGDEFDPVGYHHFDFVLLKPRNDLGTILLKILSGDHLQGNPVCLRENGLPDVVSG
ncbi:MAG: hypothetical protein BWY82_02566 [Verrucomicrobia bacterium ADurb.Bin474]|nr:MAG: hypothetical protein BWY82_02566 [Verrucomicrobia bacterium ADurb.Bin474]